jgi:hypothetical protein
MLMWKQCVAASVATNLRSWRGEPTPTHSFNQVPALQRSAGQLHMVATTPNEQEPLARQKWRECAVVTGDLHHAHTKMHVLSMVGCGGSNCVCMCMPCPLLPL